MSMPFSNSLSNQSNLSSPEGTPSEFSSLVAPTLANTADPLRPTLLDSPPTQPFPNPARRSKDQGHWIYQVWLLGMLGLMGLLAGGALWSLVRLPQSRDCPRIIRPLASASLKLYCAQMSASQGTAEGLLEAIELVKSLPPDHPLQQNVDEYLKRWAFDLVLLAEEQYNNGELALALDTLSVIPLDRLPCEENQCPREEIQTWKDEWQALWKKADAITQEAEKALLNQEWDKAAAAATQLLALDNHYWQVTRYNELNAQIAEVRSSNSYLARAKRLADQGGATNLAEAIKLAAEVESDNRLFKIAQAQIATYSERMMVLADEALNNQDLSGAIAIVDQIPAAANLESKIEDFKTIANVEAKTWSGQVADYREAINQLSRIGSERPLYSRSRGLITRWQKEIEDLAHLDRARTLAKRGSITGYMTAIAEVSLIPQHHPRFEQSQTLIREWNSEIQTLEDAPYLDRAQRLAEAGTIPALQTAISEANQIKPDRSLYTEAQALVREWVKEIERLEDRPYLAEAERLANAGQFPAAIAAAQRISPDRFLYDEAQNLIEDWQLQIEAEYSLQQARGLGSNSDSPESLGAAIRAANEVSSQTPQRAEADNVINRSSEKLLQIAIERSSYDILGAIEMAETIPDGTSVSESARSYVKFWREAAGL